MSARHDNPEDLLREMRATVSPVDEPGAAHARRERTIAHLRGLQARGVVRRELKGAWRRRLWVAALVLIPTAAAASSFLSWEQQASPPAEPATKPANVPKPTATVRTEKRSPSAMQEPTVESPAVPAPAEETVDPRSAEPQQIVHRRKAPVAVASLPSAGVLPPYPASSLAEENRLMEAGLRAARRGDDAGAVRMWTELLVRYPGSPLAQNAEVERFRALRRSGDARGASDEAARYLSQHPDGMATEEARKLAAPAAAETSGVRHP